MMAVLVVIGYAAVIAVIVIAVLEAGRMDKGKDSLLSAEKKTDDEKEN